MIHEILKDFVIQTYHPIPDKKLDLMLINKKKITRHQVDFSLSADHRVKMKKKQKDRKDPESCQRAEYGEEHKGNGNINFNWCAQNSPQVYRKETGELEIRAKIATIQITAQLKSARIIWRVLET